MNPEPSRGGRAPRSEALAARALEALHALARDLARARALDPAALPERLEVRLDLDLARGFPPGAERSLLEHLEARIDAALRAAAALRAGRVYCFFCASSDCSHSAPTEADQVFDGYEATGRPRWIDLPSVLLRRRDPRVDDLYERRGLAALVQEAVELKGDLIEAFASGPAVYDVLAQSVAGFFDLAHGDGRRDGAAATFQIVRTTAGDGRPRLHLNAVSAAPLFDGRGASLDPDLGRILAIARRRLASLEREYGGAKRRGEREADPVPRALSILRAFAHDLEHHERAGARRTHHGRRRSDLRDRPTSLAFPEAREAGDDRILADERSRTIVVLGRSGRAHVFTPGGRHVTSVVLRGDEIARRIRSRRWKPASPDAVATFRAGVGRG